jgi:hypothetical protein
MNETAVRQVVISKIADGTLPRDNIGLVAAATYGLGQMCAACSESGSPPTSSREQARMDS